MDNLAVEVVLSIKNIVLPFVPMPIPVQHYFLLETQFSTKNNNTHTPGYRTEGLIMNTTVQCFLLLRPCFILHEAYGDLALFLRHENFTVMYFAFAQE